MLDFDPKDAPFSSVITLANSLRELCERAGLPSPAYSEFCTFWTESSAYPMSEIRTGVASTFATMMSLTERL